jgi:hypothetical protein
MIHNLINSLLRRHGKIMSANSDASSGRPLCHCGVTSPIRNSWTTSNFGRKWYNCINYKVIF